MQRVHRTKCRYCNPGNDSLTGLCASHETRYSRGLRGPKLAAPLRAYKDANPDTDKSFEEQASFLRRANTNLETRITELSRALGEQRELGDMIRGAVVAAQPLPFIWIPPKKSLGKGQDVAAVIKFSDWHIGEVVSEIETEGFGVYNFAIARRRLFGIIEAFLGWVETLRNGYNINECVVLGEGDYISGDIHRELSVTNEFPVPVQTAKAGILLGEIISVLAAHFKKVTLYQVGADNHGRLEKKPQFKQKFQNSYSYLVNVIAEQYLARHENVKVVTPGAIKALVNICGWRFLVSHGDTVKSWMGIPYYGIERDRAREATKRMNTDKTFHYESIGHWHCPGFVSGNIMINGSLSGTNEFDHGCGRHAPPSQVAFLVHPKHGAFNFVPFKGY